MGIGKVAKTDSQGATPTAVLEARVDVRDLANFTRFLIESGVPVKSRSDIIWKAFRSITESLKQQKFKCFDSTEQAYEFMMALGLGTMNRPGRGGKAMNQFTLANKIRSYRIMEELSKEEVQKMIEEVESGNQSS